MEHLTVAELIAQGKKNDRTIEYNILAGDCQPFTLYVRLMPTSYRHIVTVTDIPTMADIKGESGERITQAVRHLEGLAYHYLRALKRHDADDYSHKVKLDNAIELLSKTMQLKEFMTAVAAVNRQVPWFHEHIEKEMSARAA